ncbi:ComC/BlpC family leader-containing pheromone/bacteriocin [Streptococcus saliviloxodontae]|uniref:Bacteriocin n=1 Tax=Streptococcus saliviloxodontae TaxID=1349416 RepID=A0ABS2PKR7_9STRE|nr:ComC/BlpC family leader-containing pheromone/bacteriocin [Streptococcus saliviloxodontae]MBM7635556.1 hypothetical protein [Streptococcus saliviloxodontae]
MNKRTMKQFNTLNSDVLATIQGGGGGSLLPLLPSYEQLMSSICGLADGLKGRKHKGSC